MSIVVDKNLLFHSNGGGFFSNCNNMLLHLINYFNNTNELPREIITRNMYDIYKSHSEEDIYHLCFKRTNEIIKYEKHITFNNSGDENQFSDYKKLNLNDILPFIKKYFSPTEIIISNITKILDKYRINTNVDNLCGIFYRGNDKAIETEQPSYQDFILKAKEIKNKNSEIKFVVQTDETEFLELFLNEFPDSIHFKELKTISKSLNTNISRLLRDNEKNQHVIDFVSVIIIFSRLKYLITTSGNCEIFITFYRNNTENLFQYLKKNKYIHGSLNREYNDNVTQVWY
jgi:hypothetical protein